ncbi:MAG TPA: BMP family protein [Phycisphaerae bacterium]|jgi:basic membrane protein A
MLLRSLSLISVLAASLFISACGDSGSAPAAAGGVKVGLLLTGSSSDNGWNQLANDSLASISKDQKIDFLTRQDVKKDNAADAIRQFESKGYNLVILHGYEYLDVAKELSDPSKPGAVKIKMSVSGGDVDSPNFQSLLYDLGPASYQLGIIAAKVSKTGKLGFIGGQPFPTVTAMQHGFEAGAKSVNPAATVVPVYTDDWSDPAKAKSKAEGLFSQGVDVVMQNVDAAGSGVFEAVKEYNASLAKRTPQIVYTFGANSNQNDNKICPDYTLASAVIKMDACFAATVQEVKDGKFKTGVIHEDLANGNALAVLNPKLTGKVIDADTQKLVDDAAKKFAAGQITIPTQ